ncbi:cytochrome P450 [Pseudonocardia sp. CA-142604]|uniref:cytochrome P450 n=1 Tax=Pseudonocardia sp. CA-142604 TaxID=3240024 RepID=UPI003D9316F3
MVTTTQNVPALDDDPFGTEILTDPYEFHRRLRDAGPVVRLPRYDGLVAMGRYTEVKATLTDWERFVSGRGAGLSDFAREKPWRPPSPILEADPPDHTAVRTVLNAVISPRAVRGMRARFAPFAEELADALVARGRFDAVTDLAEVYPLRVFPDAFGLPAEGRQNLLRYGELATNALGPRNQLLLDAFAAAAEAQEWVRAHCERDKLAPQSLGAEIWAAADRGEITHEQAPLVVRSVLSAGFDPVVIGLGNAMYALARHPQQWAALHADPKLTKFAFDEALRWESPFQTFFRTTSVDTEVAGTTIPKDTKVLLFLGSANRDSRHWGQNAEELDVHRAASGHVVFGTGIHQCVGQLVARLEAELVLGALTRRAACLELDGEPVPKLNNMLRGWASIPVRVTAA